MPQLRNSATGVKVSVSDERAKVLLRQGYENVPKPTKAEKK